MLRQHARDQVSRPAGVERDHHGNGAGRVGRLRQQRGLPHSRIAVACNILVSIFLPLSLFLL
jgi:hypothetical protein